MRELRIIGVSLGAALVLALGACSEGASAGKAASRKPASSAPSAPTTPSERAAPVNPRRTPAELLLEVASGYADPVAISFKGSVTVRGDVAPVVRLDGSIDPNAGARAAFLIVARAGEQRPVVSRTWTAEGDDYLRGPGLPTRPGRPWLRVPNREYPPDLLNEWEVFSDITDPGRHLKTIAAKGVGLRRRTLDIDSMTMNRVHGTLLGPDVPSDMCAGLDPRPRRVEVTVWEFGLSVDRLVFRCSFPGRPSLTIKGYYTGQDDLELSLRAPHPRNVTEIPGRGDETVGA